MMAGLMFGVLAGAAGAGAAWGGGYGPLTMLAAYSLLGTAGMLACLLLAALRQPVAAALPKPAARRPVLRTAPANRSAPPACRRAEAKPAVR